MLENLWVLICFEACLTPHLFTIHSHLWWHNVNCSNVFTGEIDHFNTLVFHAGMVQNDWHQSSDWISMLKNQQICGSFRSTIRLSHVIACSCSWPSGWWITSINPPKKIFILWHTIPGENSLAHVYLPAAIHVDQISWHLVLLIDHKGPPPLHHSCPQRGPTWPIPCNKFGETDQGTIGTLAILKKNTWKKNTDIDPWPKCQDVNQISSQHPESWEKTTSESQTIEDHVSMSGHHMPIALHLR